MRRRWRAGERTRESRKTGLVVLKVEETVFVITW